MATGWTSGARWVPVLAVTLTLLASAVASAQQAALRQPVSPAKATKAPSKDAKAPMPLRDPAPPADSSTRTRFIIGLERAVDFKVSALANPHRVLIDLPEVHLDL